MYINPTASIYVRAYEYVCVCLAKVYIDKNRSNLKTLPIYNYYTSIICCGIMYTYIVNDLFTFLLEFLFLLRKLIRRKKYLICF